MDVRINITCENCNTVFRSMEFHCGHRRRFCSSPCKIEFHKNVKLAAIKRRLDENPATCSFCQKQYRAYKDGQKFCSRACQQGDVKKRMRDATTLERSKVIKNCPICNRDFTPKRTLKEIYCSPSCRQAVGKRIYSMMQHIYEQCDAIKQDRSHKVLGYRPSDLLAHLQSFPEWETLKLGKWHLDHVFPIVAFVRRGITDPKLICCLENLQPLAGFENCSKNDAYDEAKFDEWLAIKSASSLDTSEQHGAVSQPKEA